MDKKIKLLLNEFEFLKKQEKDTNELFTEYQAEFTKDLFKYMDDNGLERKKTTQNKPKKVKETEIKTGAPSKYKKLFRKIVRNTHPDKLDKNMDENQKETFKEVYEETVEGYHNENYAPLLLNAMKLGIDIGHDFDEEIKMIENIIEKKKSSIDHIQKTDAWVYCNSIEENQKNKYMQLFYEKYKKNL